MYKRIVGIGLLVAMMSTSLGCGMEVSVDVEGSDEVLTAEAGQEPVDKSEEDTGVDHDAQAKDLIMNVEKQLDTFSIMIEENFQAGDLNEALALCLENTTLETSAIYFGDRDDNFYVVPAMELPEDYKFTERPVYLKAVEKGTYTPERYRDFASDREVQTVAKAVFLNGDLIGVIGMDVYAD